MKQNELTLSEYQKQVQRTCPDLGGPLLNNLHMILGMNSEFSEVIEAIDKHDEVNIGEELTDIAWYLGNYCNLNNIKLNKLVEFQKDLYFFVLKHSNYVELLQCEISKLTDYEKKKFAYKKEVSNDLIEEQVIKIAQRLNDCYAAFNLNPFVCFNRNIEKLKARYPDKFTEEKAINRDLETERQKLEGK